MIVAFHGLLVLGIIGTGLVAGVFFAFSGFVVQGLDRLPPADAARAMREINVTAPRPPLMLALFGTGAVLVLLVVFVFIVTGRIGGTGWLMLAAAAVYLVGAIGVTAAANVPRNNRLAAAPATDEAALGAAWRGFRSGWLAWNHVRALTSTASCACLVVAALAR
ncbi:DUF1772 domain-containing protein [Agromyces italicus]|uniref:anthrone oxygenase family protein n=1 Tax=Agromyces italicus TaxID=279572 RepID=UPI0003B7A54D|nr:anthrone oxygenase family protein [Agromyces italicus]